MRPVSDTFLSALRGSHTMDARARVVTGFSTGVDPDGTDVAILGGDVHLDSTADIRATLDLTTDGNNAWSTTASGLLTPYGNELYVERGLVRGDGTTEWISQGYFRTTTVEQDDVPNGPIRLTGQDRMSGIKDARLLSPVQFGTGTSVEDIFDFLVTEVYPLAEFVFDFDAGGTTLASGHIAEEDRYGFLLDLATSLGKVMYWDHEGKLRVQAPPDPAEPVFDVNHGKGGVLVRMSRALDREGVYNAVVASGEHPEATLAPVRAVARDMNPDSPTYWLGPFGPVPRFFTSPFITTFDQAGQAAETMLRKSLGLPYNVAFDAVPNPALEPLDPVRVTYSDTAAFEVHVLEKLTIPLVPGAALTAATREQASVMVEVSST